MADGRTGRAHLTYDVRRDASGFDGHDPDEPRAGFYKTRLRSGAVFVGVRIFHGPLTDPATGETMDRWDRWQALCNDAPIDLEEVWPKCADSPCDEAEYRHLTALQVWGRAHAPASGVADPRKRLDPLTMPLPF